MNNILYLIFLYTAGTKIIALPSVRSRSKMLLPSSPIDNYEAIGTQQVSVVTSLDLIPQETSKYGNII